MNIAQLFHKLALVAHVAVIVALLPKNTRPQTLGERQLQIVHSICQKSALRLTQQQVHVLGHDDVSVDAQGEATAHLFQNLDEEIVHGGRIEPSPPMDG